MKLNHLLIASFGITLSTFSHAQYNIFAIEAGSRAAIGDISNLGIEPLNQPQANPMPTAKEIADQIQLNEDERARRLENRRINDMQSKVNGAIKAEYIKEFGK